MKAKRNKRKSRMPPLPPVMPPVIKRPTLKGLAKELTEVKANVATLRLDVNQLQQLGPMPGMPPMKGDKGERGDPGPGIVESVKEFFTGESPKS